MAPPDTDVVSGAVLSTINDSLRTLQQDIRDTRVDIKDVRDHVDTKFGELSKKWDELSTIYLTKELFESEKRQLQKEAEKLQTQIDDLNADRKKLTWIVITAVIVALLSLIVDASTIDPKLKVGMASWVAEIPTSFLQ